jgi:transposase
MKLSKDKIEKLKKETNNYFKKDSDGEIIRRLTALSLVANGQGVVETSGLLKISRYTLSKWIRATLSGGIQGLLSIKKKGRQQGFRIDRYTFLKSDLLKSPSFFGYKFARWDGKLLSYHLNKSYGTPLSVRQCQRLFHSLGFSPKETQKSTNKKRS